VVTLARRVRLRRATLVSGLATLMGVGALLHVGIALGSYAIFRLRGGDAVGLTWSAVLADWSVTDLVRFGVVVAVTKAYDNARGRRVERRRAIRLRSELAEAELELLHLRLQPHFLFNALQAISELVHVDPARADRAIVAMGELLRRGLAGAGRPVVPLAEELEALAAYVDLEKIRRTEPLDVRIDAPRETLALGVPNFVLQPLVENAIRHGLRGRARGTIAVTARLDGGQLVIAIADDGAGAGEATRGGGHGLRNVRQRLARLHGDAAGLALEPGPSGGTIARLWLPAHVVETDAARETA
jgi:LytS/YehU family sensor histidine kinase